MIRKVLSLFNFLVLLGCMLGVFVWLKWNWFKLGILVVLLIIAYSLYYVLVVAPGLQMATEQQESKKRETDLSSCLLKAQINYQNNWNQSCKTLNKLSTECEFIIGDNGYEEYKKINPEADLDTYLSAREECSCSLPTATAERWDEALSEEKAACYKLYSS